MSVKIAERLQRVRSFGERLIPLGPGVVWFSNPELGSGLCFPIQRLGYRIRLAGPTGAVEAFLTYVNPTTQPQDAYFLFPLDRNITPVKVRAKHGEHQLETEVSPNPQEDLGDQTRDLLPEPLARLFNTESERVLAINLGSVEAGHEVSLQILYAYFVTECGEEGRGFSFRLPLMSSRALTTLDVGDAEQLTLASGLERGAQVAISMLLEASDLQPGAISTSQACGLSRQANGDVVIEYDRSKPLEGRDFVLDYQLWSGPRPKAWLRSQGRHFLLNFLPPASEVPSLPRRLVFLVDGSDEMNKVGVDRCHSCIGQVLRGLEPRDSFALVAFNRDVAGFKSGDFVETGLVDEALTWLKDYTFTGVADLKALLERVVKLPRQPDSVLSIILVTAGRLGNEPELYRLLQGSRENLRFFPVILGRKADPHFARAASKATGGLAFRALNEESLSRVSERLLEETRQPVLEVIGIQDRGLGFQGDSLTPKYPSGLSPFRPISILGLHTGAGGVEAGGKSSQGIAWSEQVEPVEVSHKVLPVVWAQVKAAELDDEARMLDRAERGILRNVVRSLSEDYSLSNSHTAVVVRDNSGRAPRFAPHFEPWRWLKVIEKVDENAKSANELLEEQKAQKGIKGGRTMSSSSRGLKMKEHLGGKATTIYGSKLGHQNRLSGAVKEGLFSKPVLGGARLDTHIDRFTPVPTTSPVSADVEPTRSAGNTAVMSTPETDSGASGRGPLSGTGGSGHQTPRPPTTTPPLPTSLPPTTTPPLPTSLPPTIGRLPTIGPLPTIAPPPTIASTDPISIDDDEFGSSPDRQSPPSDGLRPIRPVSIRTSTSKPSFTRPTDGLPTIDPPTPKPTPPLELQPELALPTPRELAAQVSAQARTGSPEVRAKEALGNDPAARQVLMNQMRQLHGALGQTDDVAALTELTDDVLWQLAKVAPDSELLVRAYGLGYQGRGLLSENLDEAKQKLKFWLSRFAKLF